MFKLHVNGIHSLVFAFVVAQVYVRVVSKYLPSDFNKDEVDNFFRSDLKAEIES